MEDGVDQVSVSAVVHVTKSLDMIVNGPAWETNTVLRVGVRVNESTREIIKVIVFLLNVQLNGFMVTSGNVGSSDEKRSSSTARASNFK